METPKTTLTLDAARQALELHVQSTKWLRRDLARKLRIDAFEPSGSFHIKARWFTEARSTSPAHEPYRGGLLDGPNNGRPPAPWDVPVPIPGSFIHQDHIEPLPHTDEVRTCHGCNGGGTVTCPRCSGSRRVSCSHCGGDGRVNASRTVTRTNSQGQSETYTETYTESCNVCGGDGKVTCPECNGDGNITCPTCRGATRLKHFVQLLVRWNTTVADKIIEKSDLPDSLVGGAQGIVIHAEEEDRLEPSAGGGAGGGGPYRGGGARVNSEVDAECDRLLAAFRLPRGAKLHRQSIHVRSVPVYEARYSWGKETRRFWVFGNDEQVYAPKYPLSLVRLGFVIGLPMAAIAIGAALFMVAQQPPAAGPPAPQGTTQPSTGRGR